MGKVNKIEGWAKIINCGGTTDIGGPNEVSFIRFQMSDTGREYRWVSEKIDHIAPFTEGQQFQVRGFVRPNGRSVYRVTIKLTKFPFL